MQDPNDLQQQILQQRGAQQAQREALQQLQQAKLEALQQVLGNYGNYRYLDLNKLIDPGNNNWTDYTYWLGSHNNRTKRQGHIGFETPAAQFINNIRNAKTIDDIKKQYELWDLYKPLNSYGGARDYVRYLTTGGYQGSNAPYGGSRPVFPTTDEPDPVQTTAGGTQDVQGAKTGSVVAKGGTQGTQIGNGTYASSGVAKGGTKTIGYDPNPGNISLAYAMRNAPEQERRTALIDKWNQQHGGNTYASAGTPRGGVVSPATMMRTSGVQPVQAAYGNNAPMGEGFDYTRTYDPMSNSMRPNDSYSYYDPSRNVPSGGDGTDLTLTYDPMTGQMIRR